MVLYKCFYYYFSPTAGFKTNKRCKWLLWQINLAGKCSRMRLHFPFAELWTASEIERLLLCCPQWWLRCVSQASAPVLWPADSTSLLLLLLLFLLLFRPKSGSSCTCTSWLIGYVSDFDNLVIFLTILNFMIQQFDAVRFATVQNVLLQQFPKVYLWQTWHNLE